MTRQHGGHSCRQDHASVSEKRSGHDADSGRCNEAIPHQGCLPRKPSARPVAASVGERIGPSPGATLGCLASARLHPSDAQPLDH